MGVRSYSLKRKAIAVNLEAPDGTIGAYELRDLSGGDRDTYLEELRKRNVSKDPEKVEVKDTRGLASLLVSLSLHDASGRKVPAATVDEWPGAVVHALLKDAREISGLDDGAVASLGNGSGASG